MGLAPIEKLPVELLQSIFIDSVYNLSLLKASPYIAPRSSSEYIYNATANHYIAKKGLPSIERSAAQTFQRAGCLCGSTPRQGCFDPQWSPDFADATNMPFSTGRLLRIAWLKARFPKKLLRGPWTEDRVQFLRFLLWTTSITVNWKYQDAALSALARRRDAMWGRNSDAVQLFSHNHRLDRVADLSLVQFAVMKAGCDRSIIFDTMLTADRWGDIRGQCDALDQKCAERIRAGDPKGQWVKTKLAKLRDYDYHDHTKHALCPETGDYNGGWNDQLIVKELQWDKVSRNSLVHYEPSL